MKNKRRNSLLVSHTVKIQVEKVNYERSVLGIVFCYSSKYKRLILTQIAQRKAVAIRRGYVIFAFCLRRSA